MRTSFTIGLKRSTLILQLSTSWQADYPIFRGKSGHAADITRMTEFDPGCVKTHTSAKCRKHNSPARHRTSRVQYDLTLRDAIARRYFYVWRDRWSFRTAKTHNGPRA
jgi:hypothetical protein